MTSDRTPSEAPAKDCQVCRTRRISCDRTLPHCRKCASRKLRCPGYGINLRWGQGVASRGKLTGQAIPVRRDSQISQKTFHPRAVIAVPNVDLQLPARWPGLPFDSLTAQLLDHFDRGVATRLAWVDDLHNPWRSLVLPLSHDSSTVRYSVLALASKDLAAKYPADHHWAQSLQAISRHNQNVALSWLSKNMRDLLQDPTAVQSKDQARHILASALLLYNLELLTAPAAQWRIHIQCAREIIQWNLQSASSALYANVADVFLFYEYYYTSVYIGLTTFDPIDQLQDDFPTHDNVTIFSDFIRIMHSVTRAERQTYTTQPVSHPVPIESTLLDIEIAKARMMQMSHTIKFKSDQARQDFECLVDMFYHATLIYTHRVFSDSVSPDECIQSSLDVLLEHVLPLSCSAAVTQDLVWPLFITGTESRGNPQMQNTVETAMMNVIRLSGNLDRSRVLSFLKTFWSLDLEPGTTWIQYARDRCIDFSFLVIL
ncbi:Zn(II)2Cys6 transcription factor [Aspergillus luchuensis]|uniref:Zn(2)-C6 fungal-type domain-containing protein n=2 Tax=Aspergillus kawachii TaxID=1069201 RepID=A0A7R7WCX0_ASPKA|nr:uncharacterized protein AKAW2_51002S [Aspergillus luchuensis]OJZ82965.1 hypothetical protein ASPFODRAFT_84313 [Aspergillus luchuensis CBS 106.47]BCS00661.1 hypothetical protein AKAW2_51002S [Aspergillus luchuensis]